MDVVVPPQVEPVKVTSPWNEDLFTMRSDLNPRYVESYQKFGDKDEIVKCVVLHYKSDWQLFLCRENIFQDLTQFQSIIQY